MPSPQPRRRQAAAADPLKAGFLVMVGRALRRRCPRCGGRGWFTGWFRRVERCQTCGYKYERAPGFVLGEVTMNTIVTFGLLGVVIVVGIVASYPDVPVVPLMIATLVVAIVVPVVFYPWSSTLWAAVDLAMHPLDEAAVADAAAHADEAAGAGRAPAGRPDAPPADAGP
jgi:uncharacterized protein (DUF983 family)